MSNTTDEPQAQAQAHAPEAESTVVDAPPEQPPVVVAIEVDKKEAKEKAAKERKKKKAKPPSHPPYFQVCSLFHTLPLEFFVKVAFKFY